MRMRVGSIRLCNTTPDKKRKRHANTQGCDQNRKCAPPKEAANCDSPRLVHNWDRQSSVEWQSHDKEEKCMPPRITINAVLRPVKDLQDVPRNPPEAQAQQDKCCNDDCTLAYAAS